MLEELKKDLRVLNRLSEEWIERLQTGDYHPENNEDKAVRQIENTIYILERLQSNLPMNCSVNSKSQNS
jgi:hypothetical protein